MFTTWNQVVNARISSAACAGAAAVGTHDQLHRGIGVAIAAPDRRLPVALDLVEEAVAALVAQHLADQPAERVDVLAQRRVLCRERNVFACHGRGWGGRTWWMRGAAGSGD